MTDQNGDRKSVTLVLSNFLEAIFGSKTQIRRAFRIKTADTKLCAFSDFFQKLGRSEGGFLKRTLKKVGSEGDPWKIFGTQIRRGFPKVFVRNADPKGVFKFILFFRQKWVKFVSKSWNPKFPIVNVFPYVCQFSLIFLGPNMRHL